MNLDSYTQPGEEIHYRTQTKKGDNRKEGELACTDTRLLFITNKSALDVQLSSIDEIKYSKKPIEWGKIIATIILLIFGGISLVVVSEVEKIPNSIGAFIALGGVIMAVALLIEAFLAMKDTLIIRTNQNAHKFTSGDLENFPHAIRGATQS